MTRPMPAPGSPADVAAEFRLHGLRAQVAALPVTRPLQVPIGDAALVLRGTPIGDIWVWVRTDGAHFFGPNDYPAPMVPIVDVDVWEAAAPRPRLLLVASSATRALLVCSVRKTYTAWVRQSVSGPRGFMPAFTCPREQLKTFGWLKSTLL